MAANVSSCAKRAGFAVLLGLPNAGKSTLLNRLVGQKVSIVSAKPQTTRARVTGVLTEGNSQVGFIDTPGIFAPRRRLDRAMVRAAWQALDGADAIILLVDAAAKKEEERLFAVVDELQRRGSRAILALNKIDRKVDKGGLLPLAARLNDTGAFDAVFMISALDGDGVEDLKRHVLGLMPEHAWFYGEDQLSDLPSQLLAAEITREQLYRQLQQELPYAAMVRPESWETKKDGSALIRQTIVVAREGHRPIVLGKGGARIKAIGEAARKEIGDLLGTPAHLFLDVKVDEKWQDRSEFYRMFGLEDGG